jgi:ubiquinone/menaquinone biosynthesis C-methylase UbiE
LENLSKFQTEYWSTRAKEVSEARKVSIADPIQKDLEIKFIDSANIEFGNLLEVGCGNGVMTRYFESIASSVTALDISDISLEVLQKKFNGLVTTVVGNIEELPFPTSSFDLIISCGVLSYGDPSKVDSEILRVLRPGGTFIFIDSLNHNPIFKLNRWIRFMRGNRSLSTVIRIPKMTRVEKIASSFQESQYKTFGKWIWLHQLLRYLLGSQFALRIYDLLEGLDGQSKYGFKIVAILKNKNI